MGLAEYLKRTNIANVVAGSVLLIAAVYAAIKGDVSLLKEIALIAAGYLFGTTIPRGGSGGGQ